MRRIGSAVVAVVLLTAACTSDSSSRAGPEQTPSSPAASPTTSPSTSRPESPTTDPTPSVTSTQAPGEPAFSTRRATRTVSYLAEEVGPRLATGPGFRKAAGYLAARFRALGYVVERQPFPVPAGDSWGVPVAAGTSINVVATPRRFDPRAPYVVVGAHLDTVAVSPGAEDNASGVAVLLETARRVSVTGAVTQVVLVAFGGEEPRGPADDQHHFGSLHYVAQLSPSERRNLRGMVSMDRVGVGEVVPIASVGGTPIATRAALARSADRLGIGTSIDGDNAASDHDSFADAGLPAARLGSTPYAAYHSAADVPSVVDPAQLRRVGRVIWDWLLRAR